MPTIYPLAQTVFVNKQGQSVRGPQTSIANTELTKPVTKATVFEGEFIKTGDSTNFTHARDIFERANQFALLTNNAQNGLQSYTFSDTQDKREALRHLMGVDLYA